MAISRAKSVGGRLEALLEELQEIHRADQSGRPMAEVAIDILGALVEASQLQTEQIGQLLAGQKRQANAFGQLRKALEQEQAP